MKRDLDGLELATTHYLHGLVGDILELLATHFGGMTTINDLRVGSYIGLRSLHEGEPVTNKEIAEKLGISPSTVTKIVADFVEQKWVKEKPHPYDGRKKQLYVSPSNELADHFEKEFRRLINDLLERHAAKEIVLVDPAKKSF